MAITFGFKLIRSTDIRLWWRFRIAAGWTNLVDLAIANETGNKINQTQKTNWQDSYHPCLFSNYLAKIEVQVLVSLQFLVENSNQTVVQVGKVLKPEHHIWIKTIQPKYWLNPKVQWNWSTVLCIHLSLIFLFSSCPPKTIKLTTVFCMLCDQDQKQQYPLMTFLLFALPILL